MIELLGTIIILDIFRCSVTILVGPTKKSIIDGLPKLYKKWRVSSEDTQHDLKEVSAIVNDKDDTWKMPSGPAVYGSPKTSPPPSVSLDFV